MPRKVGKPEQAEVIEGLSGQSVPQGETRAEAGRRVLVAAGRGDLVGVQPEPIAPTKPGHITRVIMVAGKPQAMLVKSSLPWRR